MKRAPTVAAVVASYLALAGAALLAWLAWPGQALPAYVAALCGAPLLVHGVIVVSARRDPKQLILGSFAWGLFAPILLLMWGATSDLATPPPAPPVEHSSGELDPQALSAGSIASQQVPSTHPDVQEMRAFAFADGSELRSTRFADGTAAARYLDFVRATFTTREQRLGDRRGMRAQVGERFVYWERHGRVLLELHAADERQALARMRAQGVPPPAADALAKLAAVQSRRAWPFALGYSLAHALALCVFVAWAGAATTRVDAAPGARPISSAQLLAQLDALNGLRLDCAVTAGVTADERVIDLNARPDAARAHRLILSVDAARCVVYVREFEGAYGAPPRDASEADMRTPGELGIDPSRPPARKVWAAKLQVTIIDAQRLAESQRDLDAGAAERPARRAAEGVIHLICALVTRAGFAWQPIFFGFQRAG